MLRAGFTVQLMVVDAPSFTSRDIPISNEAISDHDEIN